MSDFDYKQKPVTSEYEMGWERIFGKIRYRYSSCCHSGVLIMGRTTKYYVCTFCKKPCDLT